jgi:dolichol-phosphate mannosyltransferase
MSLALANDAGAAPRAESGVIDLSVVLPVYNEQDALPEVLAEAESALRSANFRYEIVFVDDASTDRSFEILEAFRQRHPDVRLLRHPANRGIAGAFETLYAAARGEYVFLNSSDGQWRTAECLRMMAVRDRFDLVIGKRRHKQYGWWRRLVSGAFNALPRLLFGAATHDAGSIKLFRRDVLAIPLCSRGPFREAERILRARKRGFRVGVVEVEHRPRHGGRESGARWHLIFGALGDLGRCWWSMVVRGER